MNSKKLKLIIAFFVLLGFASSIKTEVLAEVTEKNKGEIYSELKENKTLDEQAPIITKIYSDKENYKVGENAKIYLNVKDDSEIVFNKNRSTDIIIGTYNEQANYYSELKYDKNNKRYYTELEITDDMKYSTLKVLRVGSVSDDRGNIKTYYPVNLPKFTLTVVDGENKKDEEAPKLNNFASSKTKVKVGEEVKLTFDVTDNLSGIENVEYTYRTLNGDKTIEFKLNDDNKYEASFKAEKGYEDQNFAPVKIKLMDKAKNISIISENLEKLNIEVEGKSLIDSNNIITSVAFDKNKVKVGEDIKITVSVDEKVSKYIDKISFEMDANMLQFGMGPCILKRNGDTNTFEGIFNVKGWLAEAKVLNAEGVRIRYTTGNESYFNILEDEKLTVKIIDDVDGWIKEDNQWYYYKDGVVQTGWQVIDGKDYYMNQEGAMQTNKWIGSYYVGNDGKIATNKWVGNYYVDRSGKYVKNKWIGDYYVDGSGKYVKNKWVGSYYTGSNGKYVKNKWVKTNNKWYYCDGSGEYLKNISRKIGNKTYKFNSAGVCLNP